MDRLLGMKVFEAVAKHESFAGASRALNMTAPAVTRIIAKLETHLGAQLLIRTTRNVRLTEAGSNYLEDCHRILQDVAIAEAAVQGQHDKPRGVITITASALFGRIFVMPIIMRYLDEYPDVTVRALFDDKVVNIIEEGLDVSVRIGHLPDSSLMASKVGNVRRVICASPDYLAKVGIPNSLEDLKSHKIIVASNVTGPTEWRFGTNNEQRVVIKPRVATTSNSAAIQAAENGWGITRVLSYQVAPQLKSGVLQTVLSDYQQDPLPIHIMRAQVGQTPAKVKLLIDMLVQTLRVDPSLN